MFCYTLEKHYSIEAFKRGCLHIESIPGAVADGSLLQDVDCSLIQRYRIAEKEIVICADAEVDAVYVDSEITLADVFGDALMIYEK